MHPYFTEATMAALTSETEEGLRRLVAITRESHGLADVRRRLVRKAVELHALTVLPLHMRQEALDLAIDDLRDLERRLR
jgi:hypothetical protein